MTPLVALLNTAWHVSRLAHGPQGHDADVMLLMDNETGTRLLEVLGRHRDEWLRPGDPAPIPSRAMHNGEPHWHIDILGTHFVWPCSPPASAP